MSRPAVESDPAAGRAGCLDDVAPDGRFLMMRRIRGDSLTVRMLVVEHFTEELKPGSRRP